MPFSLQFPTGLWFKVDYDKTIVIFYPIYVLFGIINLCVAALHKTLLQIYTKACLLIGINFHAYNYTICCVSTLQFAIKYLSSRPLHPVA
jgi:hypothetical protein